MVRSLTLKQAVARAHKLAKFDGRERYVVYEPDEWEIAYGLGYHVATEWDLETQFAGISERCILYNTVEGWYS